MPGPSTQNMNLPEIKRPGFPKRSVASSARTAYAYRSIRQVTGALGFRLGCSIASLKIKDFAGWVN
jgi:hypothetical protein